jgi:putative membrane-bound dehydrogenase-like protein
MIRTILIAFLVAACLPGQGALAGSGETRTVLVNGRSLELAAGFELEVVAAPPLVERPICADFDEQGRLYVAEAAGTSDSIQEHMKTKPHRVLRLEDVDGDGRFDRRTIFADGMMIPQGSMWLGGSLYVAAPPSIWKLTDTDGDGVADERTEWFKGSETMGCANDVRGPYLGPDGFIYWCKGGLLKLSVARPGKSPFVTSANHVFRRRPDGSDFEPVMIGGMDNPVEVAFTPGGEPVFTTTQFQVPGTPRTDGLFHAVWGGVYPKDLAPVHEFPWTGPSLLPVLIQWGASAPAGVARAESRAFGPEFQDNLYVAHFNFHKVTRHVLARRGASFQSHDEDLLACADVNFHPTDVIEDADGSLLVIETGGWYRFCCPSSSLFRPEVLGAIYRIRRRDMARTADPRGVKLAWDRLTSEELARLLGDPRPAGRRRAISSLAARGSQAVPALTGVIRSDAAAEARKSAVWAATRIPGADARATVRAALADSDEDVRQAALHAVSAWRDRGSLLQLLPLLRTESPHNRRAAAEAIGRLGDRGAVPALLEALAGPADRVLEHSLTFALIELADRSATAAGLESPSSHTRRAALVALEQMTGGSLTSAAVVAELAAADLRLRDTAWWIAERHPEWDDALLKPLQREVRMTPRAEPERQRLVERIARFASRPATSAWIGAALGDDATPRDARLVLLRAVAIASSKQVPPAWIAALTHLLTNADNVLMTETVAAARALRIPRQGNDALSAALLRVAATPRADLRVRLSALLAIEGGLEQVEPAILALLLDQLEQDRPAVDRSMAAEVLARAKLSAAQLEAVAGRLRNAGPLELGRLLPVFDQTADERIGRSLVAALNASPARASLDVGTLGRRLARFGAALKQQGDALLAAIAADRAAERATLERLLVAIKHNTSDVRRGHELFHSTKLACDSCHAIAYVGGTVGPALTQIGRTRTDVDLLESIVFPSATLVQGYESVAVATSDGRVVSGVIVKNSPEAIVLATGPNQEVRLARDEIEALRPSKASVMPDGLATQLTPRELGDLLAFLKSCQ